MAIPDEDLQLQADAAVTEANQQAAAKQDVIDTLRIARDTMVDSGDQEGALEAQRQLQGLEAPVLDIAMEPNALGQELPPTLSQRGLVTDPNQLTRARAEAQNAATMRGVNGQVPDERVPGGEPTEIFAPNDLLSPTPVAGKGGGAAPQIATFQGFASTEEVASGLEKIAQQRTEQFDSALSQLLESKGMAGEAVQAWKASNADLDAQELYQEVSKRMQENDQKVEQVRQYFMNLSGQSVNPARLYANGGTMTASLAVAVGALSQAMLGPGAPNTALNILESALERDIRAQEMTLNNARAAGQGMLTALQASQEILGDRVQAMQTTKLALREDLLARLQSAVTLTGNATAQANLAQVYAASQEKALIDRAKLDGQIQEYTLRLSAGQVRNGKLAKATQQVAQDMANRNATQAPSPAPTAAPAQAGISASDVAGKPARAKTPSIKATKPVAAAPTAPPGPSYAPVEGDRLKDAAGNIAGIAVKASTGQLVAGEPIRGMESDAAVYDREAFNLVRKWREGNSAEVKLADEILRLPGSYKELSRKNTQAIEGIRQWIKDNPGMRQVSLATNIDGVYTSPEAQKLQRYVSMLSGPAIRRYKAAANMTDAVSEKERALALGDLASGSNQFLNTEGLRMIADNAAEDNAAGLREIESKLHQYGIAIVKKKSDTDVFNEAGKGKLRGVER